LSDRTLLQKYTERTAAVGADNAVNGRGFDGDDRDDGAVNSAVDRVLYFLVKDDERGGDATGR
jgi:hypothetical protein